MLDKPVNLAKLKQYSIMHHLEIIDNYLYKNILSYNLVKWKIMTILLL